MSVPAPPALLNPANQPPSGRDIASVPALILSVCSHEALDWCLLVSRALFTQPQEPIPQ